MSHSLNELDALCRKAARGAGCSWGLAEDAGKAARWLHAHNLPGAASLLHCLLARDGDTPPRMSADHWRAATGTLCPLSAGTALADHATHLLDNPISLGPVRNPILLAPFAAMASAQIQRPVLLEWPGVRILISGNASHVSAQQNALLIDITDTVTCATATSQDNLTSPPSSRADLPHDIYQGLDTLARRTYAPATEASRAAGAGAGLTDND